jgi:hypothetical protein
MRRGPGKAAGSVSARRPPGTGHRLWRMGGLSGAAGIGRGKLLKGAPQSAGNAGGRARLLARDKVPTAPRVCRVVLPMRVDEARQ